MNPDIPGVEDWKSRARTLAERLAQDGSFGGDRRLRRAFETTPRHVFVPRFLGDGPGRPLIDGADPATTEQWLAAVYSDTSLVVQTTPTRDGGRDLITSSSTMPGLMAHMLALLGLPNTADATGCRVLEIGTATGYNAAILCALVGYRHVTTVELHPGLATAAHDRLTHLGLHPAIVTGNGASGHPPGAPYERVIATCAVDHVPAAWIAQLAPGGRIVADLRSHAASNLVVLDQHDPGQVSGRLLRRPGHFMWMRPDPDHPLPRPDLPPTTVHDDDRTTTRVATVGPGVVDRPGLRTLIGITDPTIQLPAAPPSVHNGADTWPVRADDGSWCDLAITPDATTVRQGGPRRLWDDVEDLAARWHRLGCPSTERYGLTADADGTHVYWLDGPDQPLLEDHLP